MVGITDPLRWGQNFSKLFLTLLERYAAQVVSVSVEKVESVIRHGGFLLKRDRGILDSEARLNTRKFRATCFIENDNLAILNRFAGIDSLRQLAQLRIFGRYVPGGAGAKLNFSIPNPSHGAFAIPF